MPIDQQKRSLYFFNKNGGIQKERAPAKQSLLRWPCPLPSDGAIPVLWQNLESNVNVRTHIAAHGRSLSRLRLAAACHGPPTATIPARRLVNMKHPSRLEPRTFVTGTCAFTTRSPTLYQLSYRDRRNNSK